MALPMVDFAVLAVSLIEVNPGLTFWTIVTFVVVALVLRKVAWGPILELVKERESAIEESISQARHEREQAEKLVAEQRLLADAARKESAELLKRNQAEIERIREELLAKSRKEAESLVAGALRQIEDEKARAMAEIRGHAADLAIAAAQKLLQASLDEPRQRRLVEEFLGSIEPAGPGARPKA